METKTITIKATFKTNLTQIYSDWLSSEGHTAITGGQATASQEKGAPFTAWDGYIEGVNLELEENRRIVQSWRTMEFNIDDIDSQIEVLLEDSDDGVQLTLTHSNIPQGDEEKYKLGWEEHYLQPMSQYYNK